MQYWIGILGIFKTLEEILLVYYSTILVSGIGLKGREVEAQQIKDNCNGKGFCRNIQSEKSL